MSKSKRQPSAARRRRSQLSKTAVAESTLTSVLKACVAALLFARLLVPPELAHEGRTLWIVQLWLGMALIWAWDQFREGDFRIRAGLCDALLWVVVAGHVISAAGVLVAGGHQRHAINAAWEWVGLGISLFLMRQVVRTAADRNAVLLTMLASAVAFSALGMWQHYVFYPSAARQYEQLRTELTELENAPPLENDALREQRLAQIRLRLAQDEVPTDEASRKLWEQRLRSSTEPMGPFALANTFAGWLAVWIVVGLGCLWSAFRREGRWWKLIGPSLCAGLVTYCLLLTKSRTAWIGLLAGLAGWGLWQLRPGSGKSRRWIAGAAVGAMGIGVMLWLATLSGGFDRAVISEAPKSLEYRLEYWGSSWQVVREHPLLGVGPGNFRQHYVKYKLPESSEEIADPHNLVLDLWTSGGILAVLGFAGFVAAAGRSVSRTPPASTAGTAGFTRSILFGAGVSFGLVSAYEFLLGAGPDPRLPVLLVVWLSALALLRPVSNAQAVPGVCWLAGGVALLVHLMGAGGVGMPAITQIFLVLIVLGTGTVGQPEASRWQAIHMRLPQLAAFAIGLALFLGCLFSATLMVLTRESSLKAARLAVIDGNPIRGERLATQAAEADPLSPDPHAFRAALAYQSSSRSSTGRPRDFDVAVAAQRAAVRRDPHHFRLYETLGTWYLEKSRRERDDRAAEQAVEAFETAVELYPNRASLRSRYAEALSMAGRPGQAAEHAGFALRLDEINHSKGHQDKYLPAEDVERLRRLTSQN